jgi:hypothetical protein
MIPRTEFVLDRECHLTVDLLRKWLQFTVVEVGKGWWNEKRR